MIKKLILVLSLVSLSFVAKSEDPRDHDHDSHDKARKEKPTKAVDLPDHDESEDKHEHADSDADHEDEHGNENAENENGHDEENAQVGPDKGIVEADKEKGFKLSPEAEVNFAVKKIKVQSADGVEIPQKALVTSTVEVNVYRYRDGFYKRIDFDTVSKNTTTLRIKSKDIKQGDEIATTGLGFLRVTEIAAFDGAPEGHSH